MQVLLYVLVAAVAVVLTIDYLRMLQIWIRLPFLPDYDIAVRKHKGETVTCVVCVLLLGGSVALAVTDHLIWSYALFTPVAIVRIAKLLRDWPSRIT